MSMLIIKLYNKKSHKGKFNEHHRNARHVFITNDVLWLIRIQAGTAYSETWNLKSFKRIDIQISVFEQIKR